MQQEKADGTWVFPVRLRMLQEKELLGDYETTLIRSMLKEHGQRVGVTATALSVDRSVLYKKCRNTASPSARRWTDRWSIA